MWTLATARIVATWWDIDTVYIGDDSTRENEFDHTPSSVGSGARWFPVFFVTTLAFNTILVDCLMVRRVV